MMKLFILLNLISLSFAYSIWPQPQVVSNINLFIGTSIYLISMTIIYFTRGTANATLNPTRFQLITYTPSSSPLLKNALARYENYFFPFPATGTVPGLV